MRYIKRDLTPVNGVVEVFYEDTHEVLFTCDPYIADTIVYTWNNQKKILAGRHMGSKRQEVYECRLCGAAFTDPFDHVEQGGELHKKYVEKVKESGYSELCLCGSQVKLYEYTGGGWDRSCDSCKMVFDKDESYKKLAKQLQEWSSKPKESGDAINTGLQDTTGAKSPQIGKDYSTSGAFL